MRLFNPPAAADPYLTGSAAITESEIAQMQAAPDNDVQQEIGPPFLRGGGTLPY